MRHIIALEVARVVIGLCAGFLAFGVVNWFTIAFRAVRKIVVDFTSKMR